MSYAVCRMPRGCGGFGDMGQSEPLCIDWFRSDSSPCPFSRTAPSAAPRDVKPYSTEIVVNSLIAPNICFYGNRGEASIDSV